MGVLNVVFCEGFVRGQSLRLLGLRRDGESVGVCVCVRGWREESGSHQEENSGRVGEQTSKSECEE